ncbi:MAG: helix-turn-helix transcriptional regulator [Tannerellaceae bacterium]|nr:helix-turn-helix transcriptional regulator [Tannerellaceae bacterium]
MIDIISALHEEVLKQDFPDKEECPLFQEIEQTMYGYSKIENCIAIISNFKTNKSHLFYGDLAYKLGITHTASKEIINSVCVDKVLNRIHPEDLLEKHLLELQYIRHLKSIPSKERSNYYMAIHLRMLDTSGNYLAIYHRIFSLNFHPGSLSLVVCFYNSSINNYIPEKTDGLIINSLSGETIKSNKEKYTHILTNREKEILSLIEQGKMSKEISDILYISKNTVDRHRQNILEKLRVKNSLEACRIAKKMGLL